MADSAGNLVAGGRAYYAPFGAYRGTAPTQTVTDRGFTGHLHNNTGANGIGLIYMQARFYVPGIGRFASADTIVPEPLNPQSYNRYSYVNNSPLGYIDPSGHADIAFEWGAGGGGFGGSDTGLRDTEALATGAALGWLLYTALLDGTSDTANVSSSEDLGQFKDFVNSLPEPREQLDPIQILPRIGRSSGDNSERAIYQFAVSQGLQEFSNGPGEFDFDGVSVAVADLCGNSPAQCLSEMFGRTATGDDYYRETTWGELAAGGFTVMLNGGQQIPGSTDSYPAAHASITHALQTYRENGSPKWSNPIKAGFRNAFGPAKLVWFE